MTVPSNRGGSTAVAVLVLPVAMGWAPVRSAKKLWKPMICSASSTASLRSSMRLADRFAVLAKAEKVVAAGHVSGELDAVGNRVGGAVVDLGLFGGSCVIACDSKGLTPIADVATLSAPMTTPSLQRTPTRTVKSLTPKDTVHLHIGISLINRFDQAAERLRSNPIRDSLHKIALMRLQLI